jgi:WXG100 family type VII secretion target
VGITVQVPPDWGKVTAKADQVNDIKPVDIQGIADQFTQASRDSADHVAQLKQTSAPLAGLWKGTDADAFFASVQQVVDAGQRVNDRLDDVARELTNLQTTLTNIKNSIQSERTSAQSEIDATVSQANADIGKAETAQAAHQADPTKPAPDPSPEAIASAANDKIKGRIAAADGTISQLLGSANGALQQAGNLAKQQIAGGYSAVRPPGSSHAATHAARSTGGLHHSSGGGGGGGGGGGLGPSGGPPSTQPPGNVEQWIRDAIKILQENGIPVTDADIGKIWTIIEKESGGNPNAINNWDCVPLETMILTRRDWLKHDQVEVGDETIGYNPATGRSEWTRITRVVHHSDAPLVRLSNSRWQATTTPNHRWVNLPRVAVRRADLPLTRFVTSDAIRSRDRLLLAAAADTPSSLDITVQEAAILGWIAGDGHVETRRHRPTMSMAQSKPSMVGKIRGLLEGIPHADYIDDRGGCGPRHQFRLDHDYARDLLARAGNPKSDACAQVLAMSTAQRAAWLESITDAEGTRSDRAGYTKPQVTIYQAPGAVLDAVTLAVYLSGARPRVLFSDRAAQHASRSVEGAVHANNPIITGAFLHREDAGRGDVWCVTTELGTWTAREADHVFLTGNSNAAAGHPSKGLMQCIDSTFNAHKLPGHDDIYNPVDNIIAGVRYTFDRYGGFAGHPGLKAMAAGGGYQGY